MFKFSPRVIDQEERLIAFSLEHTHTHTLLQHSRERSPLDSGSVACVDGIELIAGCTVTDKHVSGAAILQRLQQDLTR
jgi:hypothetical protein